MARPTDYYLDPPDEPETTLEQDLHAAVGELLKQCDEFALADTPPVLLPLILKLRSIHSQMPDELPEYDDPIDAGVPIAAQQAEYEALVDITDEVTR